MDIIGETFATLSSLYGEHEWRRGDLVITGCGSPMVSLHFVARPTIKPVVEISMWTADGALCLEAECSPAANIIAHVDALAAAVDAFERSLKTEVFNGASPPVEYLNSIIEAEAPCP